MSPTPEQQRQRAAYKRKRRQCARCSAPHVPGRTMCQVHLDYCAAGQRRRDRAARS